MIGVLAEKLPGVPGKPLAPAEQLEAIKRVQAQAEHRVKLGQQLFKAAEAHTSQHRALVDQIKQEQATFQDELHKDVARSLQTYDQWVGHLDETLTQSLHSIEDRISQLQANWAGTEERINTMLRRSEALLDQSRQLLRDASEFHAEPVPAAREEAQAPAAAAVEPEAPVAAATMPTMPHAIEADDDDDRLPMPVDLMEPEQIEEEETISQGPMDDDDENATAVMHGGAAPSKQNEESESLLYSQLIDRLRERRAAEKGQVKQVEGDGGGE